MVVELRQRCGFSLGQDLGRWGVKFERGTGPLLRSCAEGERQHVERRASGVWGSGVWT